jgi:hypothetical protein
LDWILLIYTLPSQPSRKRAYVWRELKRLGAIYLRDGVALAPRRPDIERRLQEVAERVEEYEGEADLVVSPNFGPSREEQLIARFQDERSSEYRELHHACVRFLRDVLHEVDAEDFGFPDVDALESELGRLERWRNQIEERDYFRAPEAEKVRDIVSKCQRAFERFTNEALERADISAPVERDDVFERLGGGA